MKLFSEKQSRLLANYTIRDMSIQAARRDGYEFITDYNGYALVLCIDEDRSEGLKKNLYEIIAPDGLSYRYSGRTYGNMSTDEMERFIQAIESGEHEGKLWR